MWWFRLSIFYMALLLLTVFFACLSVLALFLPKKTRYFIITRWSFAVIFLAKHVCGLSYFVKGYANLPPKPFVALCNHQSLWETIFMQTLLPQQSWVLKKELLRIPFFGWGLACLNPIAIDRSDRASIKNVLLKGAGYLQNNICILIYPEGTRLPPGQKKAFSRSGAQLAINAQVPVVPIAHNAGNFWPKGLLIKKPGIVTLSIGQPIFPKKSDSSQEITKEVQDWIEREKSLMSPTG